MSTPIWMSPADIARIETKGFGMIDDAYVYGYRPELGYGVDAVPLYTADQIRGAVERVRATLDRWKGENVATAAARAALDALLSDLSGGHMSDLRERMERERKAVYDLAEDLRMSELEGQSAMAYMAEGALGRLHTEALATIDRLRGLLEEVRPKTAHEGSYDDRGDGERWRCSPDCLRCRIDAELGEAVRD